MRLGLVGVALLAVACTATPEPTATPSPPRPAAAAPDATLPPLAPPTIVLTRRGDGVGATVSNPNARRMGLQSRLGSTSRFHITDAAGKFLSSYDVEAALYPDERFLQAGETKSTSISSLAARAGALASGAARVCYQMGWSDEDREGPSAKYQPVESCISWPAGDPVLPRQQ